MSKMTAPPEKVALNETLPCVAPGCECRRAGMGRYCHMHAQRMKHYGSVDGRAIRKKDYRAEVSQIRGVFKTNKKNPAVLAALEFLDEWMDNAVRCEDVPGREEIARVRLAGATSRELLIDLAAATLWLRRREYQRDVHKELPFHMGRHAILIRPRRDAERSGNDPHRYRMITSALRKEVGRHIQTHLGLFLRNMAERVILDENTVVDRSVLLKTPIMKMGGGV